MSDDKSEKCVTVQHVCAKEENIDRIERKVDKIYTVLIEGNGRPPVIGQIAIHDVMMRGIIALNIIIVTGLVTLWLKG